MQSDDTGPEFFDLVNGGSLRNIRTSRRGCRPQEAPVGYPRGIGPPRAFDYDQVAGAGYIKWWKSQFEARRKRRMEEFA